MANYANLKSDIAGVIRTNNNEEITGDILQEQLLGMVDSLGAGFQYKGVATPTTAPGTPDENVFYIASTAGTYTNFGGLVVADGEVAILKYNGSWAKEVTGAATAAQVTQLGQQAIYDVTANNTDAKFASLSALLSSEDLSTLIPIAVRCGGMSIRFVQSSDNKYVQYRLMADEWSTDTKNWAIADDGVYVKNPEYVYVKTDNEGKILWAIKADGGIYWGVGVPQQVIDYITDKIDELQLDKVNDILTFLGDISISNLQTLLNAKANVSDVYSKTAADNKFVEKEEGKSLIDEEYAQSQDVIENPEWLEVKTDSEGKILEGYKNSGKKYIGVPVETNVSEQYSATSHQYSYVFTINDKIVFAIEKDANLVFGAGVPNQIIEYITEKISEVTPEHYDEVLAFLGNYVGGTETLEDVITRIAEEKANEVVASFDVTDTTEVAIGKLKSYGTYKSELDACPVVNDYTVASTGYKVIGKDQTNKPVPDRIVVMNHDDIHWFDYFATRKIYAKFGFNGSFCYIFMPFTSLDDMKSRIPNMRKLISDGNEIGLHAIMNCSYWRENELYDVKPDGSGTFTPLVSEIKGNNADGTGVNTFGKTITGETLASDVYNMTASAELIPELAIKVIDLTQDDINVLNRQYCHYSDEYIQEGIESLSIIDYKTATFAEVVQKTRLQWIEYFLNGLVDNTIGYSSTASTLSERFTEDYSVPENANVEDYYPDADHLMNGKMVYWNDINNVHYAEALVKTDSHFTTNSYQLVGKFTKGLYKDAFSTCNYEVIDRCIEVSLALCRHYYNLNKFTDCHTHGIQYLKFYYRNTNGIPFIDRDKILPYSGNTKIFISRKGAFVSCTEIMNEFGCDYLNNDTVKGEAKYAGTLGFYYGQQGIRQTESHFGGEGRTNYHDFSFGDYIAAFGHTTSGQDIVSYNDFITFFDGINDWTKFFYENKGQWVTRNEVNLYIQDHVYRIMNILTSAIGTGKVPSITCDTLVRNPGIIVALDVIYRFCKYLGYKVVPFGVGRDKILSTLRNTGGNLFPNPSFEQSILKYFGGSSTSNRAYMPDGWYLVDGDPKFSVTVETVNNIPDTRVMNIENGSAFTRVFGLPAGKYKLTYYAKNTEGDSRFNTSIVKNGDDYDSSHLVKSDTLTSEWAQYETEIDIPEFHRNEIDNTNPASIICGGYENNVMCIQFSISTSGTSKSSLANIELRAL